MRVFGSKIFSPSSSRYQRAPSSSPLASASAAPYAASHPSRSSYEGVGGAVV